MVIDDVHIARREKSVSRLLDNDMLHIYFLPDNTLEAIDFEEGRDDYAMLGGGRKLRHLIEFGQYCSATNEARTWAEQNSPEAIAEALVIKSLAQRILVRFYLSLRKNKHPIKVFGGLQEAKDWLNEH